MPTNPLWPQPKILSSYRKKNITVKEWTNWQWQLSHTIKSAEELKYFSGLSQKDATEIAQVAHQVYEKNKDDMRITPYLLSLIDLKNFKKDPIALQHFPDLRETEPDNFHFEKVWEQKQDFLDGNNRLLQQKYPDIVVVRVSNTCQSFCRFCFEKERTLRHDVPTKVGANEFTKAIDMIRKKKNLRQVLLSGGDPLVLTDFMIKKYVEELIKIPQLKNIRINTRTLLHNPYRITPEFAKMLGDLQQKSWAMSLKKTSVPPRGKQIKIGVHFNHPLELTSEAITAIHRLQAEGIELYNQTVVLKNINDDAKTLQKLFRTLREEGVDLHYISHAMAVPGTSHFRTTVKKIQELMSELQKMKEFRGQLPHPEMSHPAGKQIIPTTMNENFYEDILIKSGKKYRIIRFLSDITGKWEVFPDGE